MFNLFREFDLINGFRKKEYILAKQKLKHETFDSGE